MTALVIFLIIVLVVVILLQISKVSDLASKIRGEEEAEQQKNDRTALYCLLFLIGFMIYCVYTGWLYKDIVLWYGPHTSASAHGGSIDSLFNITAFWTGIVFVITHILLFWFAYKYRNKKGVNQEYITHNNTIEYIWTGVPALVLVFLVAKGLTVWNDVMGDVDPEDEYMEIEAIGSQFQWEIRYPGPDGKLGTRNYKLIDPATNPLGLDFTDEKSHDDLFIRSTEFFLPVDKQVRVRITAKDVLHNFYLPHHRVKMDAIPGLPTYFKFTPAITTADYRKRLKGHPDWMGPAVEDEPDGPKRWEAFEYELACAELCGYGHYSMRRVLRVVEDKEYQQWLGSQKSYYLSEIRGTDADPNKGGLLGVEIKERSMKFLADVEQAISTPEDDTDNLINLEHVFFETGSAQLKDISEYELDNVASVLNKYKNMIVELGGHTDSTGNADANQALSQSRADNVRNYLIGKGISNARLQAVGYGPDRPVDTNDTDEGRQNNRRTEMRILTNNI